MYSGNSGLRDKGDDNENENSGRRKRSERDVKRRKEGDRVIQSKRIRGEDHLIKK